MPVIGEDDLQRNAHTASAKDHTDQRKQILERKQLPSPEPSEDDGRTIWMDERLLKERRNRNEIRMNKPLITVSSNDAGEGSTSQTSSMQSRQYDGQVQEHVSHHAEERRPSSAANSPLNGVRFEADGLGITSETPFSPTLENCNGKAVDEDLKTKSYATTISPVLAVKLNSVVNPQPHIPAGIPSATPTAPALQEQISILSQDRSSHDQVTNFASRKLTIETGRGMPVNEILSPQPRPSASRAFSTPSNVKHAELGSGFELKSTSAKPRTSSKSEHLKTRTSQFTGAAMPSPGPTSIPLPPLSLPTYLQLELSSHRPSQLYIHRPAGSDFPYESSRVKIERLLNFLFLPHQLESVLWFGTLACLDSWLYTFTILPLRLFKSLYILTQSWTKNLTSEVQFISAFIYSGTHRMWQRRRSRGVSAARKVSVRNQPDPKSLPERQPRLRPKDNRYHRRAKSVPSMLLPDDKADILKSLLIIFTCMILLRFDASRMYHWVRGQAAIKLYVIYNVLEVCDRLLSAIGQDVLECLFSQEALERKPDGHSKVLRPFWLFILALGYTTLHATALFYQVVTLNVAVNSYSNALITLLMSNQFVEIKSTVFKKFEKENLFQLTCADVVERFQLWHMLMIIAARNIVETGGLNWGFNPLASPVANSAASLASNVSNPVTQASPPLTASSILPRSFTLVPSLLSSLTAYVPTIGHVLGPFIIVLGSEMLIDWLKHAYINKFNNTRPVIYGRFLDILAKDYYTNAFGDQNLTKRLGLPVLPLSCLMIRASVQTYRMFVAAWLPSPSPSSTSLASIHEQYSASRGLKPTSTAAAMVKQLDDLLYRIPSTIADSAMTPYFTAILITLLIFLVLLACKLILGMMLLAFARSRYRQMKERERNPGHYVDGGRRVGGWGVVEVDEEKRRWIYEDDPLGMKTVKDRDARDTAKREAEKDKGGNTEGLDKVKRYEMIAKRIW